VIEIGRLRDSIDVQNKEIIRQAQVIAAQAAELDGYQNCVTAHGIVMSLRNEIIAAQASEIERLRAENATLRAAATGK
jgi:uncharacterized protein (DUF305 family)